MLSLRYRQHRTAPVRILIAALILFTAATTIGGLRDARARTIDGSGNNLADPLMGSAGIPLLRIVPPDYADGVSVPAGAGRPGARAISNAVSAQDTPVPSAAPASGYVWQWGQFVDHDIDLTGPAAPPEPFNIPVPAGDLFFDPPPGTGTMIIMLTRSIFDPASGTGPANPRQQINEITAWIDASNVYGSDPVRAAALRTNDGTGRLRTSAGNLLPFNTAGLPNAGGTGASLFLAGDVRANEQAALTAMHTLFVREHNRLARLLRFFRPHLSGDEIYAQARRIVGAEIQAITFNEFLPILLGKGAIAPYAGYDPAVDAGISNIFSTASYRFGHSLLSAQLLRLRKNGKPIAAGHLPLRDAFFDPARITDEGGIEPLLRGLAKQRCQEVDTKVVDAVRNFLFGPPGAGGFDLVSLNIQRGRDHGLPGYNQARVALGLAPVAAFSGITSDDALADALAALYGNVNDVDVWVGGLAEDHLPGAMVGELIFTVLKDQFERLRDGDRFWYENAFSKSMQNWLSRTRLSHVIRRNTAIGGKIQKSVFIVEKRHRRHRNRDRDDDSDSGHGRR